VRIFLSAEVIEDGNTIEPISIGMVDERDCALHLCNSECDLSCAEEWVKQFVFPQLPPDTGRGFEIVESMELNGLRVLQGWGTRKQIADQVLAFMGGDTPEFWGYYSDYDWVVLCQLFGKRSALPVGWPMFCSDLRQLMHHSVVRRSSLPIRSCAEHNAIADAVWVRSSVQFIDHVLQKEHTEGMDLPTPRWRV
jgi:hypothetical protein